MNACELAVGIVKSERTTRWFMFVRTRKEYMHPNVQAPTFFPCGDFFLPTDI